jgi:hypothetical protein
MASKGRNKHTSNFNKLYRDTINRHIKCANTLYCNVEFTAFIL